MRVKVNGQEQEVAQGCDIHTLLAAHKLSPDKVAVEINRRLIRTAKYNTPLSPGDEIEIVTFVGGG
jgi:thiamine biosynthesis protein ThiS